MEFDLTKKITIELDMAEALCVLDVILKGVEETQKMMSFESMSKYFTLRKVGDSIVNHIVPKEQQADLLKDFMQNNTLLEAIKREREHKRGNDTH